MPLAATLEGCTYELDEVDLTWTLHEFRDALANAWGLEGRELCSDALAMPESKVIDTVAGLYHDDADQGFVAITAVQIGKVMKAWKLLAPKLNLVFQQHGGRVRLCVRALPMR